MSGRAPNIMQLSAPEATAFVAGVRDYAIFMIDPTGHVLTWNEGAKAIKGYTSDEILGESFTRFYTPEDQAASKPQRLLATALAQGRVEDEGWRVRRDGSRFWADVVITPVRDAAGHPIGFCKVTRDLTERRQHEAALQQAEIAAAAAQLRSELAEEQLRQRDDFIAIVAHELRTPLSALLLRVQGWQHALIRKSESDPDVLQRLKTISRQADRLSQMVEHLLEAARIVTGRFLLHTTGVDLAETVRTVVAGASTAARQAGSDLRMAVPGPVIGQWDGLRLRQVLTDLVGNAIKFGNAKPIDVTLADTGETVTVTIRDQGIGIPPEALARIFERFERAVPLRHYAGIGLGLYVARHTVEAHGGLLTVDSQLGTGSRFTLTLPKHPPMMAAPTDSDERSTPHDRPPLHQSRDGR